jgi:hypothetical protein
VSKKKKEGGRKYYSHWHLPTPLLFDRRFFSFSIKEKISRASERTAEITGWRRNALGGWLAFFPGRKKIGGFCHSKP